MKTKMMMLKKTETRTSSASSLSSISTSEESEHGCFTIFDYIKEGCLQIQSEDTSFVPDEGEEYLSIITTKNLPQPHIIKQERTRTAMNKNDMNKSQEWKLKHMKATGDISASRQQISGNTTSITSLSDSFSESDHKASQDVPDYRRKLATFQWLLKDAIASRQARISKKAAFKLKNDNLKKEKNKVMTESNLMKLTVQLSSLLLMESMLQDNIALLRKKTKTLEEDAAIETRAHEIKIAFLQELVKNAEAMSGPKVSLENYNLMKESAELSMQLEKMKSKLSFSESSNDEMESDVRILQDAIDSLSKAYNSE
jgi:hypothetical protein